MKKKLLVILTIALLAMALLAACGGEAPPAGDPAPVGDAAPEATTIVVGATAQPHAEILEVVKEGLAAEGVNLEIRVFTDYVLLNPALNDGEIDANYFQHIPYLDDYNANNNADLQWTVKVHVEPMAIYSNQIADLSELSDGAKVGIPNDATNGGRALMLLEDAGLITLAADAGVTATDADITDNPKNLEILMMDAAMLPRTLDDAVICVINCNYALEAGMNPVDDSIYMETDSPYANVLAVKADQVDNEAVVKLSAALESDAVKTFIEEQYAGSVIPAF